MIEEIVKGAAHRKMDIKQLENKYIENKFCMARLTPLIILLFIAVSGFGQTSQKMIKNPIMYGYLFILGIWIELGEWEMFCN